MTFAQAYSELQAAQRQIIALEKLCDHQRSVIDRLVRTMFELRQLGGPR